VQVLDHGAGGHCVKRHASQYSLTARMAPRFEPYQSLVDNEV
jgi:hypothetical protein